VKLSQFHRDTLLSDFNCCFLASYFYAIGMFIHATNLTDPKHHTIMSKCFNKKEQFTQDQEDIRNSLFSVSKAGAEMGSSPSSMIHLLVQIR